MLEDAEETKDWFQNEERLQRRITLIEFWEEGETEELKEKAGPYYDEFQDMMEQLREEYTKDEITNRVMKRELESEGFETVVALRIVEALNTAEPGGDLTILKRKTTPEQQGELMDLAVGYYLGKIGSKALNDELNELEVEDSASELFNITNRFFRATIQQSITRAGGVKSIQEGVETRSGYDDYRVELFFEPIVENLHRLQMHLIYGVGDDFRSRRFITQKPFHRVFSSVRRAS